MLYIVPTWIDTIRVIKILNPKRIMCNLFLKITKEKVENRTLRHLPRRFVLFNMRDVSPENKLYFCQSFRKQTAITERSKGHCSSVT